MSTHDHEHDKQVDDQHPDDLNDGYTDDADNGEGNASDLQARIEELERERDELQSKYLRAAADYQNYARRAEQNIVAAREQQAMDLARNLVTVLDHFDRALEVDPAKVSGKDLLQGVEMVRDELIRVLGRFGIERIDAKIGDAFDPNRHEAMMRQKSEEVASNHVAAQFQPGYMLKEKTIRPAGVVVAE